MHIATAHKAFDAYEAALADFRDRKVTHEGAVRFAFQTLLTTLAPARWNVIGEQTMGSIRLDGVVKDAFNLTRGYWEAKDTGDDLDEEIRKKIARGYPLVNTIFEDTRRAVLYQHKQPVMDIGLTDRKQLADLLAQFFSYEEPDIVAFGKAVEEFRAIIPDLARGLETIIHEARGTNMAFVAVRCLPHHLPLLHRLEHHGRRAGGDARPAPAHRTALPHDLQQPVVHDAQCDRRRDRECHPRADEQVVQPRRLPNGA